MPNAITVQREVSELRRKVNSLLRGGGTLTAANKQTLGKYYALHVIAGMTKNNLAPNPARYPAWRKTVVGDLATLDGSPQKHTYVRRLVYEFAGRVVKDRAYSPAARYNALLIIGELNETEARGSGRASTPAVPYTPARQLLLSVLNSDDTQEMKIGALLGLGRHARLIAAAGGRPVKELVRAFATVLQQKEPGSGESIEGLTWMHRIAIDALGDIGRPGAVPFLEPIVNDASAPMMLRCAAADALGRLDYRNAANLDVATLLNSLGQLAATSLAYQIQNIQSHIQENPTNATDEGRFGDVDQEPKEDPFVKRVRRSLMFELTCVGRGMKAMESAAQDPKTKGTATSLLSEIKAVVKSLGNDKMTPQDLLTKIGPPALRIENTVGSG